MCANKKEVRFVDDDEVDHDAYADFEVVNLESENEEEEEEPFELIRQTSITDEKEVQNNEKDEIEALEKEKDEENSIPEEGHEQQVDGECTNSDCGYYDCDKCEDWTMTYFEIDDMLRAIDPYDTFDFVMESFADTRGEKQKKWNREARRLTKYVWRSI